MEITVCGAPHVPPDGNCPFEGTLGPPPRQIAFTSDGLATSGPT